MLFLIKFSLTGDNTQRSLEDTIKESALDTFAEYYAKGDFPNALVELEKLRDSLSPASWHYNMGTVEAKLGKFPEARYHFLKSRSEGYRSEALETNLSLVERELEVSSLEKPQEFSDYVLKFGFWAQGGFFTTLALLVLVGGLIIFRRERRFHVLLVTVAGVLFPLAASLGIGVLERSVSLKSQEILEGPSVIFSSQGELPPGVLLVTKSSGEWKEIIYPARFKGWVKSVGLKELE